MHQLCNIKGIVYIEKLRCDFMIRFIIKLSIKDYENVKDKNVRQSYGILSGVLGIICNLSLFFIKISIGLMMNSIAVISDAFNNLSDLGSSVITIFGAKLSSRPPDKEHPHGHGRYEYISSLIVSFIIFAVGLQLIKSSFDKILHPEPVEVSVISIAILVISVLVKLWMYSYNKFIAKKINSSLNKTVALDSLNDVASTTAIIIGTLLGTLVNFPVDGVLGLIISLLIIYTGFSTAKDSVNLLLGPSADPDLLHNIDVLVSQSQTIKSIHDLKIHDYGPGHIAASFHAVIPADIDVVEAHNAIHEMEQKIKNELGIDIVIHMDPGEMIDEK